MGFDPGSLPSLWTAIKVVCCNSRQFHGYLCGASVGSRDVGDYVNLTLCSIPEMKVIFVCGWSIERVDVLNDYPPMPTDVKCHLDAIYTSAVGGDMQYLTNLVGTDSVELRRQLVLRHFGPLTAKSEEEGRIALFDGIVTIVPPYLPSSCQGTNPSVLCRVRNILMQIDEYPR